MEYKDKIQRVSVILGLLVLFFLLYIGIWGGALVYYQKTDGGLSNDEAITLSYMGAPHAYHIYVDLTTDQRDLEEVALEAARMEKRPVTPYEKRSAARNISKFVQSHIEYSAYMNRSLLPNPPYVKVRDYSQDPEWILKTRYGGCEEHAALYNGLTEAIGIESYQVAAYGEDHVFNEVIIDNETHHIDASNGLFEDNRYYEEHWGYNLSYLTITDVYDGRDGNATSRYTDTSQLTIETNQEGSAIDVYSLFLKNNRAEKYNSPRMATRIETGVNKTASINLGGGNYRLEGYKPLLSIGDSPILIRDGETINVSLEEGETTDVKVHVDTSIGGIGIYDRSKPVVYGLMFIGTFVPAFLFLWTRIIRKIKGFSESSEKRFPSGLGWDLSQSWRELKSNHPKLSHAERRLKSSGYTSANYPRLEFFIGSIFLVLGGAALGQSSFIGTFLVSFGLLLDFRVFNHTILSIDKITERAFKRYGFGVYGSLEERIEDIEQSVGTGRFEPDRDRIEERVKDLERKIEELERNFKRY